MFYISDHGFGHATRCVALIRALLAQGTVEVLIRSDARCRLLSASLTAWTARGRVRILPGPTNVGFVPAPGSLAVDLARTAAAAAAEVAELPGWVEREVALCRGEDVSLIFSDIVPGAFVVARRLGIPGLAVTNFTWFDAYAGLFPGAAWLHPLREAYAQVDEAAVLPFTSGVTALRNTWEAPLLARRADPLRARRIRAEAGATASRLIYVGLGGSFPDMREVAGNLLGGARGLGPASLIVGSGLGKAFPGAIEIPADDPEGQDYLAACAVAVVKAGYSTVAEAVLARVPLVLLHRPEVAEDRDIAAEVERLGVGIGVPVVGGGLTGDVIQAVERAILIGANYPELPPRYASGGDGAIAHWVLEHLLLRVR